MNLYGRKFFNCAKKFYLLSYLTDKDQIDEAYQAKYVYKFLFFVVIINITRLC